MENAEVNDWEGEGVVGIGPIELARFTIRQVLGSTWKKSKRERDGEGLLKGAALHVRNVGSGASTTTTREQEAEVNGHTGKESREENKEEMVPKALNEIMVWRMGENTQPSTRGQFIQNSENRRVQNLPLPQYIASEKAKITRGKKR